MKVIVNEEEYEGTLKEKEYEGTLKEEEYENTLKEEATSPDTCIICDVKYGTTTFKGERVCEECISYIKEIM